MPKLIAVEQLSRRHGAVQAIDGVSFEVAAGEIFGLLGSNGAGKTTTLECILGLTRPDNGRVEICGIDARTAPRQAREKTGAVLQAAGLQDKITPREALNLFATFYPAPIATGALLERFGLTEKADAIYESLSGGQKQRLALALAFVGDPQVLLLDEPTTGLDPQIRREVQDHIGSLKADGRAVLLSTHDMDEAARLCDRVAVIARGRIVAAGTPHELIADSGEGLGKYDLAADGKMNALLHLTAVSLKLNFRNRMAILYGYLFPLIFLIAFWTIYRNDPVPLALHVGQFLTVTVLGSACFGLPTTIVSERERGVWRRYALAPVGRWVFVTATLLARAVLLLTAALLQLALAFSLGLPMPAHPLGLLVSLCAAAAAFLAFGMVIAMLVDNVPAVQALGQCIFLPMLMIGGVAVPLQSLPAWAQHISAFFPGRYAVEAMQLSATGGGLHGAGFDLVALLLMAAGAAIAATAMFRWDKALAPRRGWLALALGVWLAVGAMAEMRGSVTISAVPDSREVGTAKNYAAAPVSAPSWQQVTDADIDGIAFDRLPPDSGIISPVSRNDETPDPILEPQLDRIRDALSGWAPGNIADPVQRARNLLAVAAVPDILQMEQVERFVPRLVFARLQAVIPPRDLPKVLYWIAMHPDDGDDSAIRQLSAFGLPEISGPTKPVRGRIMLYAFKLLARLTGHITAN